MKKNHHFIIFSALSVGLALTSFLCGCNGQNAISQQAVSPAERPALPSPIGIKWHPVRIAGTSDKTPDQVLLLLSEDGRATGFAGVNCFFGIFERSGENGLKLSRLSTTRMAGPDLPYEQNFLKQLERVDRFELADGSLRLFAGTEEVAVFTAAREEK